MSRLYESYSGTRNAALTPFGANWGAQTFTVAAGETHYITGVKLNFSINGVPEDFVVGIRAVDSSGHPTGSDLAIGAMSSESLQSISRDWYEIGWSVPAKVVAGTQYAIVYRCPSATGSANTVSVSLNNPGGYATGETLLSADSGATWSALARDTFFEEYGEADIMEHKALGGKVAAGIGVATNG